jgi:hypothetical protein
MAVKSPTSTPRNPYMRVAFSAVLVAFTIFIVQYRKSLPPESTPTSSSKPFPTAAPSGDGATRFAWIPPYPEAVVENIRTKITHGEQTYGYSFHAPGAFKEIAAFYRDRLKAAGFSVLDKQHPDGVELHAEYPDRTRLLDVSVTQPPPGQPQPGTEVGITATQR